MVRLWPYLWLTAFPLIIPISSRAACIAPPSGLVNWWPGDGNTADLVTGSSAPVVGTVSFTAGKVGQAFNFEGTGYLSANAGAALPVGNAPRTVSFWLFTTTATWGVDVHTPFEYGIPSTRQAFAIDMDSHPNIQIYTWADDLIVPTGAPLQGWMHIAVTYNGNLAVAAYVNGILAGSKVLGGNLNTSATPVQIGRSGAIGATYLGAIDEVQIFNRPRGANELAAIVAAGPEGQCKPTPPGEPIPPVINSVTLSPASPVGKGIVTFTVKFSNSMNNTVSPDVSFKSSGSAVSVPILQTSYTGTTWTGTAEIIGTMSSGPAVIVITGAQDSSGLVMLPATSNFQIDIPVLSAPISPAINFIPSTGHLQLGWQAGAGAAPARYNVYRTTYPALSRSGLTPLISGLTPRTTTDVPPPDSPSIYYAVTALDNTGTESPLSANMSFAMPLMPVMTSPTNNANVDVSSITIQGLAQPGVLIDISTGTTGGTLATVTAGPNRSFSAHLSLGLGPFLVQARARSSVTALVSTSAVVNINSIVFPLAPTNFQGTAGDTTATLTWDASPQQTVVGYRIYRNGGSVPLNAVLLPAGQTTYQDFALTNGRTYTYIIKSVETGGVESFPTAAVSLTPVAGPGWGI